MLLDDLGFDGVDAGGLDESSLQQPGTVYATDFDVASIKRALSEATKERKPQWRATANSPCTFGPSPLDALAYSPRIGWRPESTITEVDFRACPTVRLELDLRSE